VHEKERAAKELKAKEKINSKLDLAGAKL